MNILNPNLRQYMPEVIDTFVEVYGKKNEELIRTHEKEIVHALYIDPQEVLEYYYFLRNCKRNELTIKYLKEIGVLEPHYELRKSYQKFPKKITKLSEKYLDAIYGCTAFTGEEDHNSGIASFTEIESEENKQNGYYLHHKEVAQINYLNNLRDNKEPKITQRNYANFQKSKEFAKLYEKIQKFATIYKKLNLELSNYLKDINYLKEYHDEELEKTKKSYKLKMITIYEEIKDSIPKDLKQKLEEKFSNIEERINFLLNFDENDKANIEYFSSMCNDNLEDPSVPFHEKRAILIGRIAFFENLGLDVNFMDYKKYAEIIKREEIKKIIPPEEIVDEIIDAKIDAKRRAKKISVLRNKYFTKSIDNIVTATLPTSNMSGFMYESKRAYAKNVLYENIQKGNNCCFPMKIEANIKSKNIPVMLLLITKYENAQLDYVFLHEFTHGIEFNDCFPHGKCGFDILDKDYVNPYNKKYRMYERLNETITDMIVEKIRKRLFKKGIFLAENKKMTDTKIMKDRNTDNILKIMLYPLFDKVEQELLDARLTGKMESFVTLIGIENYKDLNDAINKVDYLIQKENLKEKLKKKAYKDPTVFEYYNQLDRVKTIYESIDANILEKNQITHKEYKKSL